MADLLPSSRDLSAADEPSPRVVGLDSDDADELLAALSSTTAREILTALHEEPDTPAAVAGRVDTSLQNAQYHLGKLADAGLIEIIDTVYSEKGREMKVYAPADRPLVVFAGKDAESAGLKTALASLLGGFVLLGLFSALVQWILRDGPLLPGVGLTGAGGSADSASGQSGGAGTMAVESASAVEQATGLPPGLLVFLGGTVVLLGVAAVWYLRR